MSIPKPPYQNCSDHVRVLQRKPLASGFFRLDSLIVQHRLYSGEWGPELKRELFVRGEAVGAVLYDPHNDLIGLVEQFRVGALDEDSGPWCLEVVAGIVEDGEALEQVAIRELQEETGLQSSQLDYICHYMSSPGGSDERLHLYCIQLDLQGAGGVHGLDEEGEDIKLHVMPAEDVFAELYGGRFNNAATLISLQWLQSQRDSLREKASNGCTV